MFNVEHSIYRMATLIIYQTLKTVLCAKVVLIGIFENWC